MITPPKMNFSRKESPTERPRKRSASPRKGKRYNPVCSNIIFIECPRDEKQFSGRISRSEPNHSLFRILISMQVRWVKVEKLDCFKGPNKQILIHVKNQSIHV